MSAVARVGTIESHINRPVSYGVKLRPSCILGPRLLAPEKRTFLRVCWV